MSLVMRIFAVGLLIALRLIVSQASGNSERDILEHLLGNYGSYSRDVVRPVRNSSQSIRVDLRVLIAQIIEVDEPKQQLLVNSWIKMVWKDEFMVWNPDDYGGLDLVYALPSHIWTPSLVLVENINFDFSNIKRDVELSITADGSVTWYTLTMFRVSCKIHTKLFPFDVQQCHLTFMSWSYDMAFLNLSFVDDDDANQRIFNENGVWRLVNVDFKRVEKKYICCINPYPQIIYTLTLKRQSEFYIYSMLIPSVLLTVITLMVFAIPAESGEKVALGITNLLAFILFQQLISDNMPPQGDEIPIITLYLFSMVIIGCASILETVFVLRLFHTSEDVPIPRAVVKFSSCMMRRQKSPVTWQLVAKAVDKLMFIVFCMAAGVMVLTSLIIFIIG